MELIDIRQKLWEGSINVKIVVKIDGEGKLFLTKVYRNSYFPIIFQDIILYFSELPSLAQVPIWLEYEQVPVKWNLPVGVLHDYLHLPSVDEDSSNVWSLNLRYEGDGEGDGEDNHASDYPWEYIVPFQYKLENMIDYDKSLREIVMNQLKQAIFIINGNSKPIMNLSKSQTIDLFDSIRFHNLYDYNNINGKILSSIKVNKLPIKIYIPGTDQIQSVVDFDKVLTLHDLLLKQFPDLFPSQHNSYAIPYIQGIDATSLILVDLKEIWQTFKLIDNFLHIVFIARPNNYENN